MSTVHETSSFLALAATPVETISLDYTEIDQSLNLWSEIFPMIEKEIGTLTSVTQVMQECPESEKYVDVLMKIASRINDVEEKATASIKEARAQLKKTQLIDKRSVAKGKVLHSTRIRPDDEDPNSDEENDDMDVDESNINEQIEIPALNIESLSRLKNQLEEVLMKPIEEDGFDIDSDNRYADFVDCLSKMQNNQEKEDEDEANIVDQVMSNKCPLTQKEFVEPVQNKKCKHRYEKQVVLKYLKERTKQKRPAKCPAAGCQNILHEKDLISV